MFRNYPSIFAKGDGKSDYRVWLNITDIIANGDPLKYDAVWHMPIIEYLNAAAFKMSKRKEIKDRLEASANLSTRENNGEPYKIALLNEIVHLII